MDDLAAHVRTYCTLSTLSAEADAALSGVVASLQGASSGGRTLLQLIESSQEVLTSTDDGVRNRGTMLLAEVRRQGKPYGLIIRDITGGATNTSSYGFQAFKGDARMVYRVDPDTGRETLVRGVELVGTPLVSIGKMLAAGDNPGVFNGYCGAESGMVPVSTVAPSSLFGEVELQRSARTRSKGPVLKRPE